MVPWSCVRVGRAGSRPRRMEPERRVGGQQHGRVVVAVAGGDDPVVEAFERLDRAALLVGEPQAVVDDAVVGDDEAMAQQRRHAELAHQRRRELLERVAEDHDLRPGAELVEELPRAGERCQPADDLADEAEGEAVPVEDVEPTSHEDVVVRFVAGGAPQVVQAGALRHRDPDLRHQDPLEIQHHHSLLLIAHPHWLHPAILPTPRRLVAQGRGIGPVGAERGASAAPAGIIAPGVRAAARSRCGRRNSGSSPLCCGS